ncbi:MAG: TAXI family TRAP transporter solute-binding subunit, partial [Peptococcaceae bacterium]|nr:TAXI family TRAP transporter solute-binding subunit [Peptococcaceae bacterium]
MKRIFIVALMLVFVVAALATGCAPKPQYIAIATGGTAGVYFPLGSKMADILNKTIKNMNATAQSTAASVANMNMLGSKEVEIAFVQNDITYYAYTGTEMFAGKKVDNVRGIASLYNEVVQIVATEASGIKSVKDLVGKRVAIGAPGSGVEASARQVLEAFGLKYADLDKADYLTFAEAASNMKDGHI